MIEVDPRSSQGVYDTLLELRLQDWAHEQDPEVSAKPTHVQVYFLKIGQYTLMDIFM